MNRKDLIQLIELTLERNIQELSQALNDYNASSNLDEGDTMDPEDFSQQAELKEMEMRMQIHVDQARAQLNHLHDIAGKQVHTVEEGAIVETDKNRIFIGVSFPILHSAGKELLGITMESPAYAAMRGKAAGDKFMLGKEEYTIVRID